MSVPETAVHEDDRTPTGKHEIWLAWHISVKAISQAGRV